MADTHVTITGNVASREGPELRFTANGQAVGSFSVAVNERRFNKQTSKYEDAGVSFFDVTCWGQLAENVAESCPKGTRVTVVGILKQDSWEDKETGQKRSKIKVTADDVSISLKFATAHVQRNERSEGRSEPQQESYSNPYGAGSEPF